MSNQQSNKGGHEGSPAPFNVLDFNSTHLISDAPRSKQANLIGRLDVKPGEQQRIFLGDFTGDKLPKGFSVEITPDPNPAGSLITEVTNLGSSKQHKLIMHIANYGTKTVSTEVWRL